MPIPFDPRPPPADTRPPGAGGHDNLVRLPVPAASLSRPAAASWLRVTPGRLTVLGWLGAGPERAPNGAYRIADLARYRAGLYARAGIGHNEQARHLAMPRTIDTAPERGVRQILPPVARSEAQAFMDLATFREAVSHGVFFLLKAMILCGLIMIVVSSTPLLKTHFQ